MDENVKNQKKATNERSMVRAARGIIYVAIGALLLWITGRLLLSVLLMGFGAALLYRGLETLGATGITGVLKDFWGRVTTVR